MDEIMRLVKKARRGDKDALVSLVMMKKDQLYRIAFSYVSSEHEAMDVLQETILAAFENIKSLRRPEFFHTWYTRILINKCKATIKKKSKIAYMDEITRDNNCYQLDLDRWLDIKHGLKLIEPKFREVIIMRYMEDMSIKEVAEILQCPEGTVKSRLYYGIRDLRKHIRAKGVNINEM